MPEENGTIAVYFCQRDNCEEQIMQRLKSANTSIHCAFYNINLESILLLLQEKHAAGIDVKIVVDNSKYNSKSAVLQLLYHPIYSAFVKADTREAYMHNKFCIFDGKEILTGSMNPTLADNSENNNNIIFISSFFLAQNYEDEFSSLMNGDFGYDKKVEYPNILFNNFTIENYFCPEDDCEQHIAEILKQANTSILFMQFSFTSDILGDILLEKSKTITVSGILEKSQISKYSEYGKLKNHNLSKNLNTSLISLDTNPRLMHHKVFIVDEEIVITGSMNPSRNGNEKNDENIVIIHSPDIAGLFVDEFKRLRY